MYKNDVITFTLFCTSFTTLLWQEDIVLVLSKSEVLLSISKVKFLLLSVFSVGERSLLHQDGFTINCCSINQCFIVVNIKKVKLHSWSHWRCDLINYWILQRDLISLPTYKILVSFRAFISEVQLKMHQSLHDIRTQRPPQHCSHDDHHHSNTCDPGETYFPEATHACTSHQPDAAVMKVMSNTFIGSNSFIYAFLDISYTMR